MIVDDNADAADLLAELLRLLGHDVEAAHDGGAAVSAFVRTLPDLAFLDVDLPDIDGRDLAAQLHLHFADTTLVALTARDGHVSAPFTAYVRKPADADTLCEIIASVQRARGLP